ncbi:hypothetical protein [Pseudoxanthomonas sp. PXM01]|uniref:hypothetical protein n=1 Tax=Pseudoxanthomonas sp. PXM01 TaxID=2769295 RepID=UPI001782FC5E|nr:hypothetical protein [Pseudoxanthomonas sp. PXM01]MBD9469280.1 hypothetical protein [Pseudoxanthomonas sp. PXM01]
MSQNIVDIIFDEAALTDIDGALATLDGRFSGLVALDPVKRRRLHKMGDKSEAFCRLAVDVLTANPQILPANFDLAALQRDVAALDALRMRTVQVMRLYQRMLDTEMALGSDMMSNSVEGYQFLKVAGKSAGLDGLRKQLAARFKSKRSKEESDEPDDKEATAGQD